jgi:Cu(I)/Ag(I) efflux system periplasmic protein CusF
MKRRNPQPKKEQTMTAWMRMAGAALLAATLAVNAMAAETINGEVKKVDETAGKITLKHGAAKSLGMDEGMTMVYRVKDPAMLKQVKVGDKVQFEAEDADSGMIVTKLQKSK